MTSLTKRLIVAAAAASCCVCFLGGCETSGTRRDQMIRRNLTPELDTLHQREVDIDNALTITFDENGRMFTQDLGRAFLLNRPSRLTPEPIPRP